MHEHPHDDSDNDKHDSIENAHCCVNYICRHPHRHNEVKLIEAKPIHIILPFLPSHPLKFHVMTWSFWFDVMLNETFIHHSGNGTATYLCTLSSTISPSILDTDCTFSGKICQHLFLYSMHAVDYMNCASETQIKFYSNCLTREFNPTITTRKQTPGEMKKLSIFI